MPYVKSRYMQRRKSLYGHPRRTRRMGTGRAKTSSKAPTKSIISSSRVPWGFNLGDSKHIDRMSASRGAFPEQLFVKMRYTDFLSNSADNLTGLTGSEQAWRLNSLFDPYFTGAGHQPLGFDQLTPIYSQYTVYRVDVQVRVCSYIGTGGVYLAINTRPSNSTYNLAGLKNAGEIQEQPNNTIMDGQILQTWDQSFWINQVEGIPKSKVMNENNYSANVTTNPSNTPYLGIAVGTYTTPASSTNTIYYQVSFVFHARFWNQNPLAQS